MDSKAESKEVLFQKLQTQLNKIQKDGIHLRELDKSKNQEDVFVLYLKGKLLQIQKLRESIDAYYNEEQHFTKQYRTLEGHCGKLQTELDKVDVSGREDLRIMRKNALLEVNGLIQSLTKKAHSSGIVCPKCEVQK